MPSSTNSSPQPRLWHLPHPHPSTPSASVSSNGPCSDLESPPVIRSSFEIVSNDIDWQEIGSVQPESSRNSRSTIDNVANFSPTNVGPPSVGPANDWPLMAPQTGNASLNAAAAVEILDDNCPSFNATSVLGALEHARKLARNKGKIKRRLQRCLVYRYNKYVAERVKKEEGACEAAKLRYEQLRDAYLHMSMATTGDGANAWERNMREYDKQAVARAVRDASDDESSDDEQDNNPMVDFYHLARQGEDIFRNLDIARREWEERNRERMERENAQAERDAERKDYDIENQEATTPDSWDEINDPVLPHWFQRLGMAFRKFGRSV